MLLVADIGNTFITIGIFENEKLMYTFRLTTKTERTSDEYGITISEMIRNRGFNLQDITKSIISCVVPKVMHSFTNGIIKYFNIKPMIVESGIKTGIKLRFPNPKEVGADRIADVVAAYELYGGPIIVVDFGTATTFDLILEDGQFIAAVTSPGIKASALAMVQNTAKLPEVEIVRPDTILAKDTISSIQAGLFFGALGQAEYIIDKIKSEVDNPDIKVVATGGIGKIIAQSTEKIDYYNPDLTMHGLRIIYNKNITKNK